MAASSPFGSWRSPITANLIAQGAVGLAEPQQSDAGVWWLEHRPAEGGRYVVVRRTPDGETSDAIPPPFNVRTLLPCDLKTVSPMLT